MTVAEKLQELLDWRGISQYELARRSGVPRGSIGGYVSGRNKVSFAVAEKLAKGLNVSVYALYNGDPLPATSFDLSLKESRLVVDFRSLTPQQQELIEANIAILKAQNNNRD